MKFQLPPNLYTDKNRLRLAGFEFEFAGLDLKEITQIIQSLYGGERLVENRFKERVVNTSLGDFKVEFDSRILKEKRYEQFIKDKTGFDITGLSMHTNIENAVASVTSKFVPMEVVAPPISIDKLEEIEKLRHALYQNKAEGTSASVFYAHALHINAEIPNDKVSTLLSYLRAFLLLQYWIFKEMDINFTRQTLTPYINFFPKQYLLHVLDENYTPDLEQFILDYKLLNPTRNRPLDFYPLFVLLKGRDIISGIEDDADLIKGRPTFHYRLPDSLVDDPDWRLAQAWNSWIMVERLASDEKKMKQMMKRFLEIYDKNILGFKNAWTKEVDRIL